MRRSCPPLDMVTILWDPENASSSVTSTSVSIFAMDGRPPPKPSKLPNRKPPSRSSNPPNPAVPEVWYVPAAAELGLDLVRALPVVAVLVVGLALLVSSDRTSYASLTRLNLSSALSSPGFRSGWYWRASRRKALRTSFSSASLLTPSSP